MRLLPARSYFGALAMALGLAFAIARADEPPGAAAVAPVTSEVSRVPAVPTASDASAPARPTPRPLKRLSDPYFRLPLQRIDPTAAPPPKPPPAADDRYELPPMTVTGRADRPPSLPVLFVPAPVRNLAAEPWESPSARRERLLKKYFTPLQRMLGAASLASAEQMENAAQMNDIAAVLELSAALGQDDAAEQARLRAEYLRLFYSRPR